MYRNLLETLHQRYRTLLFSRDLFFIIIRVSIFPGIIASSQIKCNADAKCYHIDKLKLWLNTNTYQCNNMMQYAHTCSRVIRCDQFNETKTIMQYFIAIYAVVALILIG